jgi:hypothetical protein
MYVLVIYVSEKKAFNLEIVVMLWHMTKTLLQTISIIYILLSSQTFIITIIIVKKGP